MRRIRLYGTILVLPVAAFVMLALGCGGGDTGKGDAGPSGGPDKTDLGKTTQPTGEVASTGWGTLKGKVTYDGDPPDSGTLLTQIETHDDKAHCKMGDVSVQTWKVNKANKGVENVVVFLKPPGKMTFKRQPADKKTWKDEVVIDQPFCAFQPHVVVVFPSYDDAGKERTGQKFKVINTAPIKHNTKYAGSQLRNPGKNITLEAKKGDKIDELAIDLKPDTSPIAIQCDFHKWMSGYAWALNHPYAAVTNKDGEFEIKNAPAGAEVDVVAWHEGANQKDQANRGFALPEGKGSRTGQKITLKDGETTTLNFKVKQ